ncbi:beta-galactosidase trimerization domain-containing protein [Vagococcus sp. BWB3-3]|uniref:Beta-galactosidase trimerization domain-containing protein n=1 Tax=Vagococcus allomyrinae TaxID=2794353 RepID=A0A940PJ05_9ENTE|nr:beta-galactosidase trimerization domain-containing protein [Vagococcus allomyrinae]MBP1043793.1 beta-galactosidase trimerization domain-containing protein [Vagococcus allomyrinae]
MKFWLSCQPDIIWNHDFSVDVITSEQDVSQYELVIAPMMYLIREETMLKWQKIG